jgi:hypothetical protein
LVPLESSLCQELRGQIQSEPHDVLFKVRLSQESESAVNFLVLTSFGVLFVKLRLLPLFCRGSFAWCIVARHPVEASLEARYPIKKLKTDTGMCESSSKKRSCDSGSEFGMPALRRP